MKQNTWKLAGLAVLVIGLAAALVSITTEKILIEKAAGLKSSSKNTEKGQMAPQKIR